MLSMKIHCVLWALQYLLCKQKVHHGSVELFTCEDNSHSALPSNHSMYQLQQRMYLPVFETFGLGPKKLNPHNTMAIAFCQRKTIINCTPSNRATPRQYALTKITPPFCKNSIIMHALDQKVPMNLDTIDLYLKKEGEPSKLFESYFFQKGLAF